MARIGIKIRSYKSHRYSNYILKPTPWVDFLGLQITSEIFLFKPLALPFNVPLCCSLGMQAPRHSVNRRKKSLSSLFYEPCVAPSGSKTEQDSPPPPAPWRSACAAAADLHLQGAHTEAPRREARAGGAGGLRGGGLPGRRQAASAHMPQPPLQPAASPRLGSCTEKPLPVPFRRLAPPVISESRPSSRSSSQPVNGIMNFCNPVFQTGLPLLFHLQNCETHFQHFHRDFTQNLQQVQRWSLEAQKNPPYRFILSN